MARYFSNTNNIAQLQVTGEIPSDRFAWLSERLASHAFMSIDDSVEELSIGWVRADNIDDSTFDVPIAFMRDNYALFSLRIDKRSISSAVLKTHIAREVKKFLADNPNLRRPSKQKREEIKEQVKLRLLTKTQPVPTVIDAAWDFNKGVMNVFSTSTTAMDRFDNLFRKTFDGFHLTVIHPYARATNLASGQLLDNVIAANQAASDSVISQIRDNRWLGYDYLLWLLYRGLNGASEYAVSTPGHCVAGEKFAAWIDDRIVMEGGGEGGNMQKVSVTGSQDLYKEVRSALTMGKKITSGTIYIEHAENTWKLSLDGEKFYFKSCRCPNVRIEKDSTVEQVSEMEAVFFEKMFLLEKGLQLFDSLYLAFLQARLSDSWGEETQKMQQWVENEISES